MFKHLRRRLTILFSVLTAAVLAAALTATCRMAQNEAVSGADLVFANTVSAIEDAVTENNLVRDSWLASQEAAGRLVLYMEDKWSPPCILRWVDTCRCAHHTGGAGQRTGSLCRAESGQTAPAKGKLFLERRTAQRLLHLYRNAVAQ